MSDSEKSPLSHTDGDSGQGSAVIGTKTSFDRETKHQYDLRIVTWDMRGSKSSRTGTNTIVVEIGNINDNIHSPGFQHITVNNFKGQLKVQTATIKGHPHPSLSL